MCNVKIIINHYFNRINNNNKKYNMNINNINKMQQAA